eukprot:m.439054 g.439054  ORF g.439054 m.439054 type:complete len:504 (+) comp18327_c0_seq1:128-1639(+)
MEAAALARRAQDLDVPDCGECFGFGEGCKECDQCDPEKCCDEGPCTLVKDFCTVCNESPCGATNACICIANVLDVVSGPIERFADAIWILGSPLAFGCVFCFPNDNPPYDESQYPNQWDHFMVYAPCQHCCYCCTSYICMPCALFNLRKRLLDNDMSRYTCCQGFYDGPYCCAAFCPGQPFTLKAGTHGEKDNPNLCLCLETHCCLCCSFYASRHFMREERAYAMDPTEIRVERCVAFFHEIAHFCWCLGCCFWCGGCLLKCINPGDGADELGAASMRAGNACMRIARIIWNGIFHVQCISYACMIAQMNHEMDVHPKDEAIARGQKARQEAKQNIVDQQPKPGPGGNPYSSSVQSPPTQQPPDGGQPAGQQPQPGPYTQQPPSGYTAPSHPPQPYSQPYPQQAPYGQPYPHQPQPPVAHPVYAQPYGGAPYSQPGPPPQQHYNQPQYPQPGPPPQQYNQAPYGQPYPHQHAPYGQQQYGGGNGYGGPPQQQHVIRHNNVSEI